MSAPAPEPGADNTPNDSVPSPKAWIRRPGSPDVPVTGNCALGRAIGNDVVLVDDRVSRRHATIHTQGLHEFWLVDLGSRNGTYLNGRRVSQPCRLQDDDRIQIGPFQVSLHLAEAPAIQPSTLVSERTAVDLRSLACWLLVCDISGSTSLARKLAPEELAVVVGGWFARCKEVIEDTGGTINKYLGDGLLAYWPVRAETLPHIAQTLLDLRQMQDEAKPPFRVVIHQGHVLFGGIPSSGEESLAGPEVNLVFRQEKLAGQLGQPRLATEAAATLLGTHLRLTPAGSHPLPGYDGLHPFHTF
ncbi:MAG: FHA domain-containing protein [Limisphaerales bacterium]